MKLFFDTEFTGLHKNTGLISLGIIAENGKKFYAELTDYDVKQINAWLQKNVIENLSIVTGELPIDHDTEYHVGDTKYIKESLTKWLQKFEGELQFVSDVCHYDFVLLINIFGDAFDIPQNMSPVCIDINQEIARYYNITNLEAFDMNRESIVGLDPDEGKHNALHDAEVIKMIYEKINCKFK